MESVIKTWHPQAWSDFIGEKNRNSVDRLRGLAVARSRPNKLVLIGPYGVGKTKLAEFFLKSYCCPNMSSTGDPCHVCDYCLHHGPADNGEGYPYPHYTFDCNRIEKKNDLLKIIDVLEDTDGIPNVFFDELFALPTHSLRSLLTFLDNFQGNFVAAITDKDFGGLPPPLYERLSKIYLQFPKVEELVRFFVSQIPAWGIVAEDGLLRLLVTATQRSFRSCLDVLQTARDDPSHTLNRRMIEDQFSFEEDDLDPDENTESEDDDSAL